MKKGTRKITLCRETLCQLDGSALAIPHGGLSAATNICCTNTCPANTCKTCTHNINNSCTTC